MKDYTILADWLSTQINHTFDLKNLPLQGDEVITDILYEFGTVRNSFAQVEKAYVFVDVFSWISNEYKFTNRVDVGGRYLDQWVISKDSWMTIVYSQKIQYQLLPRTGY